MHTSVHAQREVVPGEESQQSRTQVSHRLARLMGEC